MKKFETTSALIVADTLSGPRLAGSIGARRAEESVADALRKHGLPVVERYAGGIDVADLMIMTLLLLGLGASLGLTARAAFPTVPWWVRGAALLSLFIGALVGSAVREHSRGTHAKIPILIASMPGRPDPVARLVIVTGLLTPRGRVFEAGQSVALFAALSVGFVTLAPSVAATAHTSPAAAWGLIVVQWAALGLGLLLGPNRRTCRPTRGDNRTGLGMVVELARTWPRPLSDRVETLFVVTPDYRVLAPSFKGGKPTLVLILDSPAVGTETRIVGRGWARDLVVQAAGNLWLPYRSVLRVDRRLGLKGFRKSGIDAVALCGRRDDSPIDAATLRGAAQLVTEVALRWARRVEAPQGESRARSSQKPG